MPAFFGTQILLATLFLGSQSGVNGASAQSSLPERVSLAVPACEHPPLVWAALGAQLEVELRGLDVRLERDVRLDGDVQPPSTLASIVLRVPHCSPIADELIVSLVNVQTGRVIEQAIQIPAPENDQRVRIVALAIVELLRERWPSLSESLMDRLDALEQAQVEDRQRAQDRGHGTNARLDRGAEGLARVRDGVDLVANRTAEHAPEIEELWRTRASIVPPPGALLGARLVVRGFLGGGAALVGPGVAGEIPVGPFRFAADASVEWGEAAHELGDVELFSVRGAVALFVVGHSGALSLGVGPLVGIGWTRAEGKPLDPMLVSGRGVDGVMVELGARASVHARVAEHFRVEFAVDVGYGLGGVDARNVPMGDVAARITQVGGAFLAASVGLAVEP